MARNILLPDGKPRRAITGGAVSIVGDCTPETLAAATEALPDSTTIYYDDDDPVALEPGEFARFVLRQIAIRPALQSLWDGAAGTGVLRFHNFMDAVKASNVPGVILWRNKFLNP